METEDVFQAPLLSLVAQQSAMPLQQMHLLPLLLSTCLFGAGFPHARFPPQQEDPHVGAKALCVLLAPVGAFKW